MDTVLITPEREEKIKKLAANRQKDLTVILENVHDPHNLGAVLRTCDSVGIQEIYALYTIESPATLENLAGHKSSSGAKKWVDIHYFDQVNDCIDAVRKKYDRIYGTHLDNEAIDLYDLDLVRSAALVFGNEHRGISSELVSLLDGNFIIPQVGMVQSLNISVAVAISLYEALRQRKKAGKYDIPYDSGNPEHLELFKKYHDISRKIKRNHT